MSEPTPSTRSAPGPLPLVIGVGNDHRGDDRSGLEVARALRVRLGGKARVEECASGGIALLEIWRDADRVLVVDAVRSGAPSGTVHRLEPGDGALLGFRGATSTHGLSLGEAVALAAGLGCLPRQLVVYGIEAESFEMGVGLTPSVARGVEEATARIQAEIESDSTEPVRTGRTAHA
ncbi:MAG: hydrogenase maturation protease [Thermoplasmata archaeon]|nr:hydrogenase maturation protease [Thermoplasmata archaeon]